MKDLWTTLPADNPLRRRIERELAADVSAADAWRRAAGIAWTAGYDVSPPPTVFSDRLVALRQTDPKAAGRLMSERSAELNSERTAARVFAGHRAWALGPPQSEIDATRAVAKQAAELDLAVEARARSIVAEQSTKTLEAARTRARKEIST